MSKEERQKMIDGLEEKLDNVNNMISKTEKNSVIYETYMGIAKRLAQDILKQKEILKEQI